MSLLARPGQAAEVLTVGGPTACSRTASFSMDSEVSHDGGMIRSDNGLNPDRFGPHS